MTREKTWEVCGWAALRGFLVPRSSSTPSPPCLVPVSGVRRPAQNRERSALQSGFETVAQLEGERLHLGCRVSRTMSTCRHGPSRVSVCSATSVWVGLSYV